MKEYLYFLIKVMSINQIITEINLILHVINLKIIKILNVKGKLI